MAETQKEKLMRLLKISEEEAIDIIKADKAIDAGKRVEFDLDPETEKMAKKFANATTKKKPTVYEFTKRERKANPTKASIIAELAKFLEGESENATENVTVTNKERQIAFSIGEHNYELTLVQKRPPKK